MTDHIPVSNILGSAAAGILARCTTHPLDTVKSRLQADTNKSLYKGGPLDAIRQTFKSEGISGFYRGFGAVIIGGTPGTIAYLCSYDLCKEKISNIVYGDDNANQQQTKGNGNFLIHFVSGISAETIACLIYVPVDVVKERLQVQRQGGSFHYNGGWDALKTISRTEGLAGIYKGYGATLASFGPFSAFYFVFYEKLKLYSRNHLDKDELPLQWIIFSSASAGALASWITSPLDMAKLRLQVQRGEASSPPFGTSSMRPNLVKYRGMVDCLNYAYNQGGVKALFRGAGARVLHFVPATTVTMSSYETFRSLFQKNLGDSR